MMRIPVLLTSLLLSHSFVGAQDSGAEVRRLIADYRTHRKLNETVQGLANILNTSLEIPEALDALSWILRYGGRSPESDFPLDATFLAKLEKLHLNSEGLGEVCLTMSGHREEATRAFLKRVSKKSPHKQVRGLALFAWASGLEFDDEAADVYVATLNELVKKHPDLKYRGSNLGEYIKGKLFAAQNLAIGMVAPEIEGEDVDGKRFKLSDYRGKVVVIDFWGDW